MKVSEVMTKNVISVNVPGLRKKALEIMQKNNVSGLPVTDEKTHKLVGMITLDDLLRNPDEEQIALIMRRLVVTIDADEDITDAAVKLSEKNIYRLPVVKDGKLEGIVTVEDLIKRGLSKLDVEDECSNFMKHYVMCAWQETPLPLIFKIMDYSKSIAVVLLDNFGKLVGVIDNTDLINNGEIVSETEKTSMNKGNDEEDWAWESKSTLYIGTKRLKLPNKPAKEFMSGEVYTVSPSTSITECARLMRRYDVEQLPVLDEDNDIVGIVRDIDLISYFLKDE